MKRFRAALAAILIALLVPALSLGADSVVTVSYTSVNSEVSTITWSWLANSGSGAVTSTACTSFKGWVFMASTDPDGTAIPQDQYDITLSDSDGVDIFGGELTNRSNTTSEHAVPVIGSSYYGARFVNGPLTMALSGNNVGSAKGVLKIYFTRER